MKLNIVPARTGTKWVKLGMQTFAKQPLALAGLFFLYMAAVIVVAQLPVVGLLIGGMLVPAATLGLMAATAEATKGRFPMPSVLISAFRAGRQRVRAMLLLGLFYTVGSTLATGIATLIAGAPAATAGEIDGATLLALALHTPLFLMFWHAPALVHWHGVTPAKSVFFSMVACLKNFGAFADLRPDLADRVPRRRHGVRCAGRTARWSGHGARRDDAHGVADGRDVFQLDVFHFSRQLRRHAGGDPDQVRDDNLLCHCGLDPQST